MRRLTWERGLRWRQVRHGDRYVCTDVLAVVEFVSIPDDPNDYVTKVAKYGRFGVASYVIVDPFRALCILLDEPRPSGYGRREETPFGERVELPLADGRTVTFDTSGFPRK
ncbi:Uma2 family endonuclease [Streptomyces sparsus]